MLDLSEPEVMESEVSSGDNLKVVPKDDSAIPITVTLSGYVNRPGRYKIKAGSIPLEEFLELGGGVSRDGAKARLEIHRIRWEDEIDGSQVAGSGELSLVSYSPRSKGPNSNPMLIDRDSLYVPRALHSVAVSGKVASPGLVQFVSGKDVDYYINMAGGYGPNAKKNEVVVINPVTGSRIAASAAEELYDGEIIFVPEKVDRK
jgi:protein involved in polysaccharide export with SLBB domain